jgi:hypothetical protein
MSGTSTSAAPSSARAAGSRDARFLRYNHAEARKSKNGIENWFRWKKFPRSLASNGTTVARTRVKSP